MIALIWCLHLALKLISPEREQGMFPELTSSSCCCFTVHWSDKYLDMMPISKNLMISLLWRCFLSFRTFGWLLVKFLLSIWAKLLEINGEQVFFTDFCQIFVCQHEIQNSRSLTKLLTFFWSTDCTLNLDCIDDTFSF